MTHSKQSEAPANAPATSAPAITTAPPASPTGNLPNPVAETGSALFASARQWIDVLALLPAGCNEDWAQAALGCPAAFLTALQQQGYLLPVEGPHLQWIDSARQRWLSDLALRRADKVLAQRHMATLMQQRMQQFEPLLRGGDLNTTLPELDREWPNIVAALDWIIESDEPQLGLGMIIPVARYCLLCGRAYEGAQYIDAVLALSSLTTTDEFVQVMMLSGELQEVQRHFEDALDRYQTAFTLTTLPNFQQPELTTLALLGLSRIHRQQNMREHALCYAQKAIELAQTAHNEVVLARARRELRQIFGDGQD